MNVPRACHVCGCTEEDCRQCIERTGQPCYWLRDPRTHKVIDICSACLVDPTVVVAEIRQLARGFHAILMALEAEKLAPRTAKMPIPAQVKIEVNRKTPDQLAEMCADRFKQCVQLLMRLGDKDAEMHSCR